MGLKRGPEADQVGSGVCERHVGSGAPAQSVQDSAFVHVLQVAQVLAQVLLRGVTLQRGSGCQASQHRRDSKHRRGGSTCSVSYSVTSCREPSVSRRTLTMPSGSSGVPSSGFSWVAAIITQPVRDEEKSQTHFDCFILFQKEIVILVNKTTSSTVCGPRRVITIKLADLDEMIILYSLCKKENNEL